MPSYIIFHPDRVRNKIRVKADVIRNGVIEKGWEGNVRIDSVNQGNEDPWCHAEPWLYSYCHATQLKRSTMGAGDILFFVSGESANNGCLVCDTVFVVKKRHDWVCGMPPKELLEKYPKKSDGWQRHLRFGVPSLKCCQHSGAYTFEAQNFSKKTKCFSFLPLDSSESNVSLSLSKLQSSVVKKVKEKTKGKYPVELTADEAEALYRTIEKEAKIRVVRIQEMLSEISHKSAGKCGGCSSRQFQGGVCG